MSGGPEESVAFVASVATGKIDVGCGGCWWDRVGLESVIDGDVSAFREDARGTGVRAGTSAPRPAGHLTTPNTLQVHLELKLAGLPTGCVFHGRAELPERTRVVEALCQHLEPDRVVVLKLDAQELALVGKQFAAHL